MSIKNEATKEEPLSPWLSYINVDDNDIFSYSNDADLGVKSDDDWGSDHSEMLEPEKPHWLKTEPTVAPDIVTGPTPTKEDLASEAHADSKADYHVEAKLEDVVPVKSDVDKQERVTLRDNGKNKELWSVNEDLGNLCLGDVVLKEESSSSIGSASLDKVFDSVLSERYNDHSWTDPRVILSGSCSTSPLSDTTLEFDTPPNYINSALLRRCGLAVTKEELIAKEVLIAKENLIAKEKRMAKEKRIAQEEMIAKREHNEAVGSELPTFFPHGYETIDSMQQTERLNALIHAEACRTEAMYHMQGISPMLLQVQQQSPYLWDATPVMPTTAEELEYWAAQTASYCDPMASQQAQFAPPFNTEDMRAFSPVMPESGNQTDLPMCQPVTASQPQMKTEEQPHLMSMVPLIPMVPMVPTMARMPTVPVMASSFQPSYEAWDKEPLDYRMNATLVSSTSAPCPSTSRTQLPGFKGSDCESSDDNGGNDRKARSTSQTTGANGASPRQKSPIYKTRRVTRRQQQQKAGSLEKNAEMASRAGESSCQPCAAGPSYQHREAEPWTTLLPLRSAVTMDDIAAAGLGHRDCPTGLQQQTQSLASHQTALSPSAESLLSEASQMALQSQMEDRLRKDNFLIEQKRAGLTYKQIRRLGGFQEAESTLRGRHRTLTKPKEERVRKPAWTEMDDHLLRRAVRKLSRGRDSAKAKISWKAVADYIYDCGGSYHFGNTTCRKRWDSLVAHN
ncbi:hypothetical protein CMQ_7542 [Grosmannia clavigera kw1407]|uniref:Myb-like domain-containing protein n=1 Tax=Grosmannia clavigera (strain kw1407 / UAMH 11150) TaxID=655863 RepID=F0XPI4_GROCL|nr:uncharacterized protein CMQ_7542 [Grosmannia clavigera kw1407]EFX00540.1 hypothetical protein CMQ_7542 [Grosmannia clavigera kw1407]